jgi:hypothetical protein
MRVLVAGLIAALATAAASRALAQAEGYLAIDGITPSAGGTGASWSAGNAVANDPSWLPISSYQLQTGSGGSAGKTQINITRTPDATSPALLVASSNGRVFAKGILDVPGPSGSQMVYEPQKVQITNYQVSGSGGSSQESFTLVCPLLEVIDKTAKPTINGHALTIPALKNALPVASGQTSNSSSVTAARPVGQPLKSPWAN